MMNNYNIKNILIVMFLGISTISFAQEEIDLFILAGQSNAQGWKANGNSYPTDNNNLDAQIRLNSTFIGGDDGLANLDTDGWVTMQTQPGRYTNGHFGPEVTFSRKLKLAGFNPAIFKYCKGGSFLATEWKQPGAGGFYDDMVVDLKIAIKELEDLGHTVNVKGFIWIQGEEDAKNDTYSAAYQANLTNLLNDLRNNVIEDNSLPIVLGVDDARDRNIPIAGFQKNIANSDANIIFTSMVGLAKSDLTHLTPAGVIQQGEVVFNDYKATFIATPDNICPIEQITRTGTASLNNGSWGQSFATTCDGILENITFDSQGIVPGGAILTIGTGNDCTGTILTTKTLDVIGIGDNFVAVGDISVVSGTTYYFKVTTIVDGETFQVDFSKLNPYADGYLFTHLDASDKSLCDRPFTSFDWKFSMGISSESLSFGDVLSESEQSRIYPNPVKDFLTISNSQNAIVDIYNLAGKLVLKKENKNKDLIVNISELNSGVYFVRINKKGLVLTEKIIKQ